jgi:sialic acid synthase SpsE
MAGWDHSISADSHELRTIVTEGRKVYASLGTYERGVTEAEMEKRLTFRRSLVATRPLERGEVIAAADLDVKRPGTGIAPDEIRYVVGRRVARDIGEDQLIGWNDLE